MKSAKKEKSSINELSAVDFLLIHFLSHSFVRGLAPAHMQKMSHFISQPGMGKFLKWLPVPSPPVLVYGRTWPPVQVLSTGPYYA